MTKKEQLEYYDPMWLMDTLPAKDLWNTMYPWTEYDPCRGDCKQTGRCPYDPVCNN